jgi:hypothetical protein
LNGKQRIVYEVLEGLRYEVGDLWETCQSIETWVNDNFFVETFKAVGRGDDMELEDVHLGWR